MKYKNSHDLLVSELEKNGWENGTLVRSHCEVCGTKKDVHMHHDDYTKPLDVNWLCRKHHEELHHKLLDKIYKHDKQ